MRENENVPIARDAELNQLTNEINLSVATQAL
jgi:hypothetical protein